MTMKTWIDAVQGATISDRAFGYVGRDGCREWTGWFFTWPRDTASVRNRAEARAVIESMERDETAPSDQRVIPYSVARRLVARVVRARWTR
jgi:hypothetical protein